MADLAHILGKVPHQQMLVALDRLAGLGLKPDWHWSGQKDGWCLGFRKGETNVCSLLLARIPLVGQVGVGRQALEAMQSVKALPAAVLRKVEAAPMHGSLRLVELPLDSGTGVSQFQALVAGKLQVLAAGPG
ncbi:MAG: hypothetical protein HY814_05030 [Candidatus Riflebacteria bacterium]|nr:hypothetical protein [Candidatus Riflebacteria bacterium]